MPADIQGVCALIPAYSKLYVWLLMNTLHIFLVLSIPPALEDRSL